MGQRDGRGDEWHTWWAARLGGTDRRQQRQQQYPPRRRRRRRWSPLAACLMLVAPVLTALALLDWALGRGMDAYLLALAAPPPAARVSFSGSGAGAGAGAGVNGVRTGMKRAEVERRYGAPVREEHRPFETARYRYRGFPGWVTYKADGGVLSMTLDARSAGGIRLSAGGKAATRVTAVTLAAGMTKRDAWDGLRAAFAPAFPARENGEQGILVAKSGVSLEFSGGRLTEVGVIDFIYP